MTPVRFLADDPGGLWQAGEAAEELGPETEEIPELIVIRFDTGEIVTLTEPYERGLIEEVPA